MNWIIISFCVLFYENRVSRRKAKKKKKNVATPEVIGHDDWDPVRNVVVCVAIFDFWCKNEKACKHKHIYFFLLQHNKKKKSLTHTNIKPISIVSFQYIIL